MSRDCKVIKGVSHRYDNVLMAMRCGEKLVDLEFPRAELKIVNTSSRLQDMSSCIKYFPELLFQALDV